MTARAPQFRSTCQLTGEVATFPALFGQSVRSRRGQLGLTQQRLSDLLARQGTNLDTSAITRIENGSRDVRLSEAARIADVLGVGLTQLMSGALGQLRIASPSDDLLADARGELDNTMQSLRDLGALVRDLTSQNAMWHAARDEQRERADEWRDKYDVACDERDEARTRVQELSTALASAVTQCDTANAKAAVL